jgi:NAD(P)-dependent dehydrogenase (short-subunit alcohol dehydrogenase family)
MADHTAVITGGARGLGQVFAQVAAEAGFHVAVIDLADGTGTVDVVAKAGGTCLTYAGDASDPADVRRFGTAVREACPPVRVVINNVGISPYADFPSTDADLWHRVLRINLDSMFHTTREFLPSVRAAGHGRIVNLTSTVVWDAQATSMSAYATSKAAVVGFTRALAAEVGVDGVTVNAIAPGIVLTPDIEERVAAERLEAYRGRQAVKRLAQPADLGSALRFLIDKGSDMVTGTVLPVNGGRVWL